MGIYNKYSKITRAMAWRDLKEDWPRFKRAVGDRDLGEMGHVYTDSRVNLVRMVVGTSLSRDMTQRIGRTIVFVESLVSIWYVTGFVGGLIL